MAEPQSNKSATQKLGPGYYNPTKEIVPLHKYKPTSSFASSAPRKFFDKEKGSIASRRTKFTMDADDEDNDQEEYLDDAVPGPGHYYSENQSGFKTQVKDFKF